MKTWYGVPSPLVTRPGATAYDDPVRTSSMSCSARAASTRSSRARPYGPKSAATCTRSAPTSRAARTTSVTGSPERMVSPMRESRSRSDSAR